jgi:hypothetical protein
VVERLPVRSGEKSKLPPAGERSLKNSYPEFALSLMESSPSSGVKFFEQIVLFHPEPPAFSEREISLESI